MAWGRTSRPVDHGILERAGGFGPGCLSVHRVILQFRSSPNAPKAGVVWDTAQNRSRNRNLCICWIPLGAIGLLLSIFAMAWTGTKCSAWNYRINPIVPITLASLFDVRISVAIRSTIPFLIITLSSLIKKDSQELTGQRSSENNSEIAGRVWLVMFHV